MHKNALKRVTDFLEYIFIFVIIAECNSYFGRSTGADRSIDMSTLLLGLSAGLLVVLLALHLVSDIKALAKLRRYAPFWLLIAAYAAAFYFLNARSQTAARAKSYLRDFIFFMLLMVLLFRLKQQKGEGLDLIRKHADVMCIVAAASLIVYLAGVFHVDEMPSDVLYSKWSNLSRIHERANLLNLVSFMPADKWNLGRFSLLRNCGFFVEPPMFSLQLVTALYTEMFLRRRAPGSLFRAALLSATLLTVSTTIGMALMVAAWGLKVVAFGLRAKKRALIVLMVCVMVGACVFLVVEKKSLSFGTTEVSGSSFGDHVEDYRASLRAFAQKPLLGGGFRNSGFILKYMNPDKVARNPGRSNSAGVVLAHGGVMLGLLCMMPFIITLMYLFRKRDRGAAFWAAGIFGLYVGVIFIYHLFLLFLMAFGYSLVEVRRAEGGRLPIRLALADLDLDSPEEGAAAPEALRRRWLRTLAVAGGVALAGGLLVGFGVPFFRIIRDFLRTHEFSISQSPLKALCLAMVLIFHGHCVRCALRRQLDGRRLFALLVWDALFLLAWPKLYSDAVTLLAPSGAVGSAWECAALLAVYGFGSAVALYAMPKHWLRPRRAAIVYATIAAVAALFFMAQVGIYRMAASQTGLAEALERLTSVALGDVFVNDRPSAAHRLDSKTALSTTSVSGFDVYQTASVVYEKGVDRPELLECGFELAELSEDYLVYTNDASVISALSGQGERFYRYYPYDKPVDLRSAAKKNGLKYNKIGIAIGGGGKSLKKGPSDTLTRGQYTITCELRINPGDFEGEAGDTPVCTLLVSRYSGKENIAQKDVTLDQFDGDGRAVIGVPFKLGTITQSVDYQVLGVPEHRVRLRSMTLRQTPDYITVMTCNCHRDAIREEYYDPDGEPYVQPSGYSALERDYNSANQVKAIRYYGADFRPVTIKGGYSEVRYGYNDMRIRTRTSYFGTEGQPVLIDGRYASTEAGFDEFGNQTVTKYFGTDGEPILCSSGYAELRRAFNAKKQIIREEYYGVDGTPIALSAGQFAMEQEFDEDGNVSVRRYYGDDGALKLRTDGYAEVHWQYNQVHRIVREEFYGAQGQPVLIDTRYAADEREYDDAGNVSVYRYYGLDGSPVVTKSGYAEWHRVFNSKKQIVREEYYGVDGTPIALSAGQYAIENEYDEANNVSVRRYYGDDGRLILRNDGYAEVHWQYNAGHKVVREAFFDTEGAPILISNGSSVNEREYDSAGNANVLRYYDAEGEPVVITAGYAQIHRQYNGKRQIVREAYFGTDGEPLAQPEGYAIVEQEYDDRGNVVVKRFYDGDGRPAMTTDGYAEVHRVYNNKKQMVREEYYGEDGAPCAKAAGHSGIEQEFDNGGELSVRRYLDARGDAMQRIDGYAEARWTYDENHVRNVSFYDLNGDPVPADGLNLAQDIPDGWSKWYTSRMNSEVNVYTIGYTNLGRKETGDSYSVQVEIEFSGVTGTDGEQFMFRAQGSMDGEWRAGNVWNEEMIKLIVAPTDGVYQYSYIQNIREETIGVNLFSMAFRCDNWASGSFRVRSLKVERGADATEWSPGV